MNQRILVMVVNGVEELELVAPVDLLRRAGLEVVLMSMEGATQIRTRGGLVLEADGVFEMTEWREFDGLLLPGGPGVVALREAGIAARVAAEFFHAGKCVAAICAAPLLLKDAGILDGVRHTAHFSTVGELADAEIAERVLVSGRVITSRGAGTAVDFGLALVEFYCGAEVRARVAVEVMA